MNLSELITLYRAQSMDVEEPYLCSDELLTLYANEAQEEACRRGQLLRDSSSPWCTTPVVQGTEEVPLNPLTVRVVRAFCDGYPMQIVDSDVMDSISPSWQFRTVQSRPTRLVTGLNSNAVSLWPRPDRDYVLNLTVQRLPLRPMRNDNDRPEIRHETHAALVEWMMHRVFSRVDSELFDPSRAALALQRFEAEFGRKAGGRNEEWVRRGAGVMPSPIA